MSVFFSQPLSEYDDLRQAIVKAYHMSEAQAVDALLSRWRLTEVSEKEIADRAMSLAQQVRDVDAEKGGIEAFMMHYDLSSDEGIMMMCLAEALLRIPDTDTEKLLIEDKLTSANWSQHLGSSESSFVNIATWGLALTGKVLDSNFKPGSFASTWKGLVKRTGEPFIRKAVRSAIKLLSEQFVLGRTIDEALKRSKSLREKGYTYSYDMLGEAARTEKDAAYYFDEYMSAIHSIGNSISSSEHKRSKHQLPSISVKLSALYPRYEFSQQLKAIPILTELLKKLALAAKQYGIALTVDAEEADRLDISLDIFEAVYKDQALAGWDGLGLAVQAYQKRAVSVVCWVIELARQHGRIIPLRLVKGAYWDSEIKWSQMAGYDNYPVFTRKPSTDLSYLCCAELLLAASDVVYPQFATHNAYTVSAIITLSTLHNAVGRFEFQSLQGMGIALHDVMVSPDGYDILCRIYAPVGSHEDLLPYLVRRLLENGANSSFVNKLAQKDTPIASLVASPIDKIRKYDGAFLNPQIPSAPELFLPDRLNSHGFDITDRITFNALSAGMKTYETKQWKSAPSISGSGHETVTITNPNNAADQVGEVLMTSVSDIDKIVKHAYEGYQLWNSRLVEERSSIIKKVADLLEQHHQELFVLLQREAGKVLDDAINELREAVDFCRYYASQAIDLMVPQIMPGYTGESNVLQLSGRGVTLCISPWNFPLAIFIGQMVAALVTGNSVIAKPAEQTSLIAARVIALMHEAGVPSDALILVPGAGETVGAALVKSEPIAAVIFTGSTLAAKHIQRSLADRPGPIIPLIAETGGLNAMIVDSSALPEQVVLDVLQSAFGSAGQRCSALRVLYLQNEVADKIIEMLAGAMALLNVGNSRWLSSDIGPVIDLEAKELLMQHEVYLEQHAKLIYKVELDEKETSQGCFVAPQAYEISSIDLLEKEVFGPILHVIRYESKDCDAVISDINAKGYGLTFGVQSRIEDSVMAIANKISAGNIYVNRNITGAVVGVQPFGGCGLSGTGPKAGGPHYLARLCHETTITIDTTASGGNASLMTVEE